MLVIVLFYVSMRRLFWPQIFQSAAEFIYFHDNLSTKSHILITVCVCIPSCVKVLNANDGEEFEV